MGNLHDFFGFFCFISEVDLKRLLWLQEKLVNQFWPKSCEFFPRGQKSINAF